MVAIDDVYGGTNRYFNRVATPAMNISFTMADLAKPGALAAAITEKPRVCILYYVLSADLLSSSSSWFGLVLTD